MSTFIVDREPKRTIKLSTSWNNITNRAMLSILNLSPKKFNSKMAKCPTSPFPVSSVNEYKHKVINIEDQANEHKH